MIANQFIVCMLVLVLVQSISAEYDVNGVCTLVPSGTRIGSIDSCQKYYTCDNGKATAYQCPAGTKFSKNAQSCLNAASVPCFFGDSNPCAMKPEGFVPKSGSCKGYIYCKNGVEVASGLCSNNMIFKDGECRYGDCPSTNANVEASFTSICQVLPNEKYFGSSKDCGKWQICKNERLSVGLCANTFVFDRESSSCVYESANTCDRVTGVTVQPDIETFGKCDRSGALRPSTTCSDYLKCEDNSWVSKSCETNFFYDVQQQKCKPRRSAITTECNRCQFSKKQFVNAVDPECRKYLICENGLQKASNTCNVGYYFDESGQACVKGPPEAKESYALQNAVCFSTPNYEKNLNSEK